MRYLQFICIISVLVISNVFSYGADIIITVPDAQITRVRTAILKIYPNIECNVAIKSDGSCSSLRYTDNQWFKEIIRRWIKDQVHMAEEIDAKTNAVNLLPTDYNNLIQ